MKLLALTPCLVTPLLALLAQTTASALENAANDVTKTDIQEQIYVTATRSEKRDLDVAAAVSSSGEDDVLEQGPGVIAAVLRAEPGIFFQQTTPGQGIPIIRGLKGSQLLHMVDGVRLNNALFRSAPNQYLGLVDSFATGRIEVVRGAQGSLYGADAMGGVMQILTHEPAYKTRTWQQENRLYGSFDSVDDGWVVNARSTGGKAGWGFAGGASYQHHGSRKSGNGERLRPSAYRSKAADLKFVIAGGERASLMLSAQAMEQPSTPRFDELVAGFGQTRPASQQFLFAPNRRTFVHARFRLQGDATWFDQIKAHAARQVITDDRLTQAFLNPVIVTEHNRSTLDGVTVQFNSSLSAKTRLVWGAEYYTDAVDSQRFERIETSNLSNEVRSRFPDGSSMDSSAFYLAADWLAADRFELNAGLRYSWFDINLPAADGQGALALTPADLTGDIHAVYDLNPDVKLVANLGRGFRPPNIFDLATLGPRPGNRFNIANPDLKPETVHSFDLGIKAETDNSELELFVFYLDYANKITSVLTGEATIDGRGIVRSENRNSVDIYGLEAKLYGSFNDHVRGFLVLNYTRGQEHEAQGATFPADRIPPLNGKVGLQFRLAGDWTIEPFMLFATAQHRLSPRDARDPRIDPDGTPGWAALNLRLNRQLSDTLQLGLRLENLTDKTYREHASGIDAPGRNIGAWLSYSF